MKNVTKRFFTVLMASIVLFTSTGFGLVEHSCAMRGKKSYSFVSQKGFKKCSAHSKLLTKNATIYKTKCCDDKNANEKVDFSQTIVSYSAKFINAVTVAIYNVFTWVALAISNAILSIISSIFTNSSLAAFSGKSLVIFVQSFLI